MLKEVNSQYIRSTPRKILARNIEIRKKRTKTGSATQLVSTNRWNIASMKYFCRMLDYVTPENSPIFVKELSTLILTSSTRQSRLHLQEEDKKTRTNKHQQVQIEFALKSIVLSPYAGSLE